MTDTAGARRLPKGAGPRVLFAPKAYPWHSEALDLANRLRADNPNCGKTKIAKSIATEVQGAPQNIDSLLRWLGEKEDTGEFLASAKAKP